MATQTIQELLSEHLTGREGYENKIAALQQIEDNLIMTIATAAEKGRFILEEIWLDDGLMKTRTNYRTAEEAMTGVNYIQKLINMYQNRITGRVINMRNPRSLR